MGYFRSFGTRNLTVVNKDGSTSRINYDPQSGSLLSVEEGGRWVNQDVALEQRFNDELRETPTATFFAHRLGSTVDFEAADVLFGGVQYESVARQLASCKGQIPAEQRENVELLAKLELLGVRDLYDLTSQGLAVHGNIPTKYGSRGSVSNGIRRAYSYSADWRDPAEYWVLADGKFLGFNNRTSVSSYLARLQKEMPEANVLAHRFGSPLNFNLAEQLRRESPEMVDLRSGRRERGRKIEITFGQD